MAPHADLTFAQALTSDHAGLSDMLSHGFGFPGEDSAEWFARPGTQLRTLKRGDRLVGGLMEIPMAQWFGGRSVSTMGVAGVGVVPEERGRGVAAHLMVTMLRGARAGGFALSTLYPASVALYRRAGYERAGARFKVSFDPRALEIARVPEMTIAEVRQLEDVKPLYEQTARRSPGYLDRGAYVWSRVAKPRGHVTKTFTVSHGDRLEGYVVLAHKDPSGHGSTVAVHDLAATSARAAQAILRLLVEYRSLASTVTWHGGPSDLFTNLLPERHVSVDLADYFMVRIVDVARALGMRGWPRGASGSLDLEVTDATLPENSGVYTLTIEDDRAVVTPGVGRAPRVTITERGLAALYTGYAQAHVLADAGWLDASEDARAQLDAWFGGPLPTTRDMF